MPTKKRSKKQVPLSLPLEGFHDFMDSTISAIANILRAPRDFFHVKHPPAVALPWDFPDKLPSLYVAGDGAYHGLTRNLRKRKEGYHKTGNGFLLIEAFLLAHENTLYPPIWVLDALAAAFRDYWKAPEAKSLDALLGLKRGRGQDTALKALERRERDWNLAWPIWLLTHGFRLTIEQATVMLASKLEAQPQELSLPEKSTWRRWRTPRTPYTADSLAKLYSRKWRREFGLTERAYILQVSEYKPDEWQTKLTNFLKAFPDDSFPPKRRDLRALLRSDRHT